MSTDNIRKHFNEAKEMLQKFIEEESNFEKINTAGQMLIKSLSAGHKIIACGNGGSMSDAMHFAEEFTGRFRENRKPYPCMAISDPAYLSCTANDYGYESVFSRYIEAFGKEGDVLMVISTSGNSPNVIQAARYARDHGIDVIGLTGKDGGRLSSLCQVEIRAPHSEYADRIQEIHIKVLHTLIDFVERNI